MKHDLLSPTSLLFFRLQTHLVGRWLYTTQDVLEATYEILFLICHLFYVTRVTKLPEELCKSSKEVQPSCSRQSVWRNIDNLSSFPLADGGASVLMPVRNGSTDEIQNYVLGGFPGALVGRSVHYRSHCRPMGVGADEAKWKVQYARWYAGPISPLLWRFLGQLPSKLSWNASSPSLHRFDKYAPDGRPPKGLNELEFGDGKDFFFSGATRWRSFQEDT